MAYGDFVKCFTHLSICHPKPEDLDEGKEWTEYSFHGSWEEGKSAGGCGNEGLSLFLTNPQYLLTVHDENSMVSMALMQKGRRQLRDEMGLNTFLNIGLTVLRLEKEVRRRVTAVQVK